MTGDIPTSDNAPLQEITALSDKRNFRTVPTCKLPVQPPSGKATRVPRRNIGGPPGGAGEPAAGGGGDMADGEVFTAATGQGLVVSTGILGDLVLPEGTFDPDGADEIRELAAQAAGDRREVGGRLQSAL